MDPDLLQKASTLPWELQLVLGSGYCAYVVAYVGLRRSHRATDTVFASLAFGLIAGAVLYATSDLHWATRAALAFGSTVAAGVVWRTLLRLRLRRVMRAIGYSYADDTESAWECLLEETAGRPTQLAVEIDDGWCFYCSDTSKVQRLPFGPFTLGTNGDVLMYADRSSKPGGEAEDVPAVFTDDWGNTVTYLPQDRIRRIAIRFISAEAAAGSAAAAES